MQSIPANIDAMMQSANDMGLDDKRGKFKKEKKMKKRGKSKPVPPPSKSKPAAPSRPMQMLQRMTMPTANRSRASRSRDRDRECDLLDFFDDASKRADFSDDLSGGGVTRGAGSVDVDIEKVDVAMEESDQEEEDREDCIESGLLLAVVERGLELGPVDEHHRVPSGARRKAGVAVRITYMYYGLAADGNISAERTRRFARQANFRRRELGLPHGSLVSGLGSWGGPENAPIKLFGFRLTEGMDGVRGLQVIEGVSKVSMPGNLRIACQSLTAVVPGVAGAAAQAEQAAQALVGRKSSAAVTLHQVAAFYLYTMAHDFYRQLNAAMRNPDRSRALPFYGFLRLLFDGIEALSSRPEAANVLQCRAPRELWRGVHLDLRQDHVLGSEVTWWGASSCTPKISVAKGFLGSSGARTLFTVKHLSAVPIKEYSAFRGEEEWLLAPGTRLHVDNVEQKCGGLSEITLSELPPPRDIR